MTYQEIISFLTASNIPFRVVDGEWQVMELSQLPWTMRVYFNAQGRIIPLRPVATSGMLLDDPAPKLAADLDLNGHNLKGQMETNVLVVDGGLVG